MSENEYEYGNEYGNEPELLNEPENNTSSLNYSNSNRNNENENENNEEIYNPRREHGESDLHYFTRLGDEDKVYDIVVQKNGTINLATLEARNNRGMTPLMLAVQAGNDALVELFLEAGANKNVTDKTGNTLLSLAYKRDHMKIIEMLLDSGVDLQEPNPKTGNTLLMEAAAKGDDLVVRFLLRRGANPLAKNKRHWTAFEFAMEKQHTSTIEQLLEFAPSIDAATSIGSKLAEYAIRNTYRPLLDRLIHGDIHKNFLWIAFQYNPEILDYFLERGANLTSLLDDVILGRKLDDLIRLLKHGVRLDGTDLPTSTFLQEAVRANKDELVTLMLDRGANPNGQNNQPLLEAVRTNNVPMVQLLIEKGANPNGQTNQPLLEAVRANNLAMVQLLIEKGANPNGQNNQPLLEAVRANNLPMVQLLIEKGAKTSDAAIRAAFAPSISIDIQRAVSPPYPGMLAADFANLDRAMSQLFETTLKEGEAKSAAVNCSFCPVCLDVVVRTAACNFMAHKCSGGDIPKDIYAKYADHRGDINWCTICNRICKIAPHLHYSLGLIEGSLPSLSTDSLQGTGTERFFIDDCRLIGGGGLDEKAARFQALRVEFGALQEALGAGTSISQVDARRRLATAFWNVPLDTVRMTQAKSIMDARQFPPVAAFPTNSSSSSSSSSSSATVNPENVENIEHRAKLDEEALNITQALPVISLDGWTWPGSAHPPTVEETGTDANGNKEYEVTFHHTQANGSVEDHFALDLDGFMRDRVELLLVECPFPSCPMKVYPNEILAILQQVEDGLTLRRKHLYYTILKKYTDRFKGYIQTVGQHGGGSVSINEGSFGFIREMENAVCPLPAISAGRRRTRRRALRHTRRRSPALRRKTRHAMGGRRRTMRRR